MCRNAAFRVIGSLTGAERERTFFLNVSRSSIHDSRLIEELAPTRLGRLGVSHGKIAIEVTETSRISDYATFEARIRHFSRTGYRIALDDFCLGRNELLTLLATKPDFIKLDRRLVSEIDLDAYKQKVVSSLVSFAESVGCGLIAEGIERVDELTTLRDMTTLRDLHVQYGQGYYLGKPIQLSYGDSNHIIKNCPSSHLEVFDVEERVS